MRQAEVASLGNGGAKLLTSPKILIVSFFAWTLANMDQAFFGYAFSWLLSTFIEYR